METLLGLHSQGITDFSKMIPGHVEKDYQKETLLGLHSQSITDFSKMIPGHVEKDYQKETFKICKETFREIKSEKLESSSHFEMHTKDHIDENLAIDLILIKAEVGNIKNQIQQFSNNSQKNCENHNNIFEFLEIVVGMNKSLNVMMEDIVSSQAQVKLIRSEQEQFFTKLKEENKDNVFNDIKICEQAKISKKLDDMGNMLHRMRQNIDELQKIHNINKNANLSKGDSIDELKNKGDYLNNS